MMGAGAAHYDLSRWGMEIFRASPRQADLMIVAGRVSQKMAPVLRQVYDQMVEPKWVISMGVCASTGGMFNNYAIVQGVDQIVPVDVYVPGCPPGPETLMHGILTLYDQIKSGEIMSVAPTPRAAAPTSRSTSATAFPSKGERRRAARCLTTTTTLVKQFTSPHRPPTKWRPRCSSGSPGRCSPTRTARPSSTSASTTGTTWRCSCATTSASPSVSTWPPSTISSTRIASCRPACAAERYEVVANFLSHPRNRRIRTICELPAAEPEVATIVDLYPGIAFAERETFDLFGVNFVGHDDLARILMPDDWIGHPAAQGRLALPRARHLQRRPESEMTADD